MLAGFEDLERLARLESAPAGHAAASSSGAGNADDSLSTDLAALLTRLIVQLDPVIGPREVRLRWEARQAAPRWPWRPANWNTPSGACSR
jgi:hypothetical protein